MCNRSWKQWCGLCNQECLCGFYLYTDAKKEVSIRQWHLCKECSSNPPKFYTYEELAAQLVTKALL